MADRLSQRTLARAVRLLAARDPDLERVHGATGIPPLRKREPGFASLLTIVCAQQVSTAAARTIIGRLLARVDPLTPENILATPLDDLRALGLSRQKATYGIAMAQALSDGVLDLVGVDALSDEDAIASLTQLKGVGRWTAEIYLLFALGRPDLWPADDLAIVAAVQRIKGLPERPDRATMEVIAEPWRPWRSVAAHMMWHYYNTVPAEAG